MNASKPLDNFPVVRTADVEILRDALARVYARPTIQVAAPAATVSATLNECRLEHVRLSYGAFGAPLCLEFPAADCFAQIVPIRGKGEITTRKRLLALSAGATATISPDAGFIANYDADYECLVLKVDRQALTDKLVALTGATIDEPLRMEPQSDIARPAGKILQQYIPVLAETLSLAALPLPSWWATQTEQLLMTMFLCGHRHNYSHLLEDAAPEAAASQVRRTEEYIEAHWNEPVTLEGLAEVAEVSAFSLFRSFKQLRGYSPLDFAARVRERKERKDE